MNSSNANIINVTVRDYSFVPGKVIAAVGDTIKWTWSAKRPHTITCDGIFPGTSLPPGAARLDERINSDNPHLIYRITAAGTYNYVCSFNAPAMSGSITAGAPLPIELTDFVATTIKNEVILDWSTGGELNNEKFEIQRVGLNNYGDFDPSDLIFVTIGTERGNGTSNKVHHYKFIDRNLQSGIYLYRLKQVDFNGNFFYHMLTDEVEIGLPSKFNVNQNYPNPFNPSTKITYEIPVDGMVTISLFDNTGREINRLFHGNKGAGYQTFEMNGSLLSSGIYYYRIAFDNNGEIKFVTKKMFLVK